MNCWEIILINSLEYHCMMSYRQKDQYTCGCEGPVRNTNVNWREDTSWYLCHFKKPICLESWFPFFIYGTSSSLTPCAMTIHVDGIDMMYVIYSFKLCKNKNTYRTNVTWFVIFFGPVIHIVRIALETWLSETF